MGFVYEDIRYEITRNDCAVRFFSKKGASQSRLLESVPVAFYPSPSNESSPVLLGGLVMVCSFPGLEPFSIPASIFDDEVCCVVGPCERRRSQVHKRDHAICFPSARVIHAGSYSFSPMFMNVFCTASFVLEAESLFGEFSGAEFSGGKCDGLFGCAPNGVRSFSVCGERYSLSRRLGRGSTLRAVKAD